MSFSLPNDPPFTIKVGDLARAIKYQLTDGDGNVVDLTGATSVTFRMVQTRSASPKTVTGVATVVNALTGIVSYQWVLGDTDTIGTYRAEWTVTWPGSLPDTFPSSGWIDVEVYEKA